MNSLRIGLVGVLVNRWGTQAAEGLLHFFEGWTIFIASAALLIGEIALLAHVGRRSSFFEAFALPTIERPEIFACVVSTSATQQWLPSWCCVWVPAPPSSCPTAKKLCQSAIASSAFPAVLGEWQGRPSLLEPQVEHALGLEDYLLTDYSSSKVRGSINLYIAYYASQRTGVSPHSPIVCMPGGGWQITGFERTASTSDVSKPSFPLNRAVIERNSTKQIVYYWFVQRGRMIANEYASKWFLLTDAILENRTDGALVRVTTPLYPGEVEENADQRLRSFIQELQPRLEAYLPGRLASAH